MRIEEAQRDVRAAFAGGFMGQLVAGLLWLASACLAQGGASRAAVILLLVGGFFVFPLTLVGLRITGRPAGLPSGHPMNGLGMQVAFTLPLSLPVVGAAALQRPDWFYPAFTIVLGAHYLPFVFLYGMRAYAVLAALLVSSGLFLGLTGVGGFPTGAWLTAGILLVFSGVVRTLVGREQKTLGKALSRGDTRPDRPRVA